MRKSKFILLILIVFLFSGCSNTLTCIYEQDKNYNVVKMKFSDDKITKLSVKEEKTYDDTDAYVEMFYYEQLSAYNFLENIEGVKYKIKERKSTVTTKIEIDFSKVSNLNSKLIKVNNRNSYNDAKNIYTYLGYDCK